MAETEFSRPLFGHVEVECRRTSDGTIELDHAAPLPDYPRTLLDRLDHWSAVRPDAVFLAEREGDGWRARSYAEVQADVADLSARLLTSGASADHPLMTLSRNSIDHALLILAAMRVGIPVAVIQPAYAHGQGPHAKLQSVIGQIEPGAIFVEGERELRAVSLQVDPAVTLICGPSGPGGSRAIRPVDLEAAHADHVEAARAGVRPDDPAKLLFTSGSTAMPKGVVNTQRMMCSNMAALSQAWPFLTEEPPRLVDWLPWNHTFGGNCCFNLVLYFGGSLYIDDGKPLPDAVARTWDNIRSARPTIYFNVPVGFEALLPLMESDREDARAFLGGVHFLFNAAAAMPSATRTRLEALAGNLGIDVPPVIGAWGSTETAPFSTVVHFSTPYADNLGVPMPGTTIRLIPADGKFELRVKGPNVTPGYWRAPEATRQAFDADGFFRIGDAGKLADPAHPEQGLRFDGRIAENFKLSSGTWVNAGALRLRLLDAVRPYAGELVVVGQDRDELGVLIFADRRECGIHLGEDPARIAPDALAEHPLVIAAIRDRLARYNLGADGSSTRIARFLLLAEPPSSEHGELTDKGSVNQRTLVTRRAADIGRLFDRDGHPVGALASARD